MIVFWVFEKSCDITGKECITIIRIKKKEG